MPELCFLEIVAPTFILYKIDASTNENIYIRYSDSSVEHTEVYYDPFLTNMEQILFPFLGDWD